MGFNFNEVYPNVKRVGFFGIGRSNLALMRLIPNDKEIVIRSEQALSPADLPRSVRGSKIYSCERAFDDFEDDILFLSPSVRRERREFDRARSAGVRFSSDLELFLNFNSSELICITGSDGKSTTTALTSELLSKRGATALLGNIGVPFSEAAGKKKPKLSICELSSFQLRYAKIPAKRAAVTNITPNHLNWHEDFEEYKNTKLSLLDSADEPIVFADDEILAEYGQKRRLFGVTSFALPYPELRSRFHSELYITIEGGRICKNGEPLISLDKIKRREGHNIKNLMTAIALTDGYTDRAHIEAVAESFSGLSHRCECFAEHSGIKFIDSSIDTSPARSAETLSSLGKNLIIILGGRGKGMGYTPLRDPLANHVKLAVITGENRGEILSDIKGCTETVMIENFEDAVLFAAASACPGDAVLLSPASTSYDAFSSFEKRGEKFKEIILNFIEKQEKQQ